MDRRETLAEGLHRVDEGTNRLHHELRERTEQVDRAGERGQVPDLNNWRPRVWADACTAAKAKATPYDGRHSYASLLIHEERALPYVTAALGHASATTTLDHYAHVFDEARLAHGTPMVEAITAARADLERRGVYPMCTRHPVRVLRATSRTA